MSHGQVNRSVKWLSRPMALVVNLALLVLVAWGFAGEFSRHRQAQEEIDRLEERAAALGQRNFELAAMGREMGTDEALEREARLKLGLRRPGEQVIIIKDQPPPAEVGQGTATDGSVARPVSNFVKWWRYFFSPNGKK